MAAESADDLEAGGIFLPGYQDRRLNPCHRCGGVVGMMRIQSPFIGEFYCSQCCVCGTKGPERANPYVAARDHNATTPRRAT